MTPLSWTTLLFVPAASTRRIESAIRLRPDAIILDLEDGVASASKPAARDALRSEQAKIKAANLNVVVRVNSSLADMVQDMLAIDIPAVDAIMVPKCVDTRPLLNVAEIAPSVPGFIALIEQPAALPRLAEIAATKGVIGMMLGPEDYCAELGVAPGEGALQVPAALLTSACAAANILPIGFPGSIANFMDLDTFAKELDHGRRLGFRAAAAIHPSQLPLIRAAFRPSATEIAEAERVVAAFRDAERNGMGVVALDGKMIDLPVFERARRLLERGSKV